MGRHDNLNFSSTKWQHLAKKPYADVLQDWCEKLEGLLTSRELEVMYWLSLGHNLTEIGEKMFVCPNTIKYHMGSIHRKLGTKSPHAVVSYTFINLVLVDYEQ